jgi:hypothetical protein
MKVRSPNYLYSLATEKKLQWTKDVVRGERSARKAVTPKRFNAKKKEIVRMLVKDKKMALRYGKPMKTRSNSNPMLRARLPKDPMRAADPTPGNVMHIANTKAMYNGWQS